VTSAEVAIVFPDSFWVPAILLSFVLGLLAPQKSFRMFMDWKNIATIDLPETNSSHLKMDG